MDVTYLDQIGILPALLIILGALLVQRGAEEEKAQRRLSHYLLLVGSGLLLALLVVTLIDPAQDNWRLWQAVKVLTPSIIAVLALIALSAKQLAAMGRGAQLWALLLFLALAALLIANWHTQYDLSYLILPGLAVLVLGWAAGRRFPITAVLLAVLLLLALLILNLFLNQSSAEMSPPPRWLGFIILLVFYAAPGLIVVIAAVLITNALQNKPGKRPLLLFTLALALLVYLAYSIFWASLWDHTSDGLSGLMLMGSSAVVAVGAGLLMAITLSGWRRAVGLLFAIVTPLLLYQSFEQGWQASYHDITQARAERIVQALAHYHRREGAYPPTLAALTPRDLLRLPQPVELQGETWCYQGGADYFRLGAFYREFFSMPVNLQVYAAEGQPPAAWPCEEQLAEMKARYYSPMEDPAAMQSPLPTPLPTVEVPLQREIVEPLLGENGMVWGSWSPDSAYFLLGGRVGAGTVTFSFLDGPTGELCPVPGAYVYAPHAANLRDHHAWLPDGRLLLMDDDGQIALLTPCSSAAPVVLPQTAEQLTRFLAHDESSGRVLAQSANQFWIFDGRALAWQLIPGVTPNPYDAHWDNAAWQPDGELLAISRLNGRDASDGSTLYLIDGSSGQVTRTLPLAEASDQSSPRVDWLLPQELLVGGSGVLRILDFSSDPPGSTDVIPAIFGLDLDFPDQVWGHGWQVDWHNGRYTLTLQANLPRDQALYLYHSATGTTNVYDEESDLLLRYPNGEMEQWTKPEGGSPPAADQFMLIDVAQGKATSSLTITGHTPRDYPRLSIAYLPRSQQVAAASSQGVSLHTVPGGKMTRFWTLTGQGFAPFLLPAPDGSALVAVRDQGGVYWIPLR